MSTACHQQVRQLTIPAAWPVRSRPAVHQRAIIPAALAPVLLTGGYLVAGALQPASYSPVRKTISAMAGQAGTDRWVMTGGIILVAGCYLMTAAGLTSVRAPARALLIVAGLAGIGIALLGWLFIETRDGSVLGLAERLTSSIQTCWPFIIAITLRRAGPRPAAHAQRERPAPAARSSPGYPPGPPSAQTVPSIPGRTVVPRPHDAGRSDHQAAPVVQTGKAGPT